MADPLNPKDRNQPGEWKEPTAFSQGKDPRFPPLKETLKVPEPAPPPPMPTPEQVKARIDEEAAQARDKARAEARTDGERKVKIKLLNDVWIEDPTHEDAGKDGIRRVKTNIPVLNEDGSQKIDPKTKAPITTHSVVDLPLSVAKMMIDAGKAERMDPL